jgi:hypothetical protein
MGAKADIAGSLSHLENQKMVIVNKHAPPPNNITTWYSAFTTPGNFRPETRELPINIILYSNSPIK